MFAFKMWCFIIPAPRIMTPVLILPIVELFISTMSSETSILKFLFLFLKKYIMSPRLPSVIAGQNTGMLFFWVQ